MTACIDRTSAVRRANPLGTARRAVSAAWTDCPRPHAKHAMMRTTNAPVFAMAVTICARLPDLTPIHCSRAKPRTTADPIVEANSFRHPNSSAEYSPITIAANAALLHVDNQSLQPMTNPAYGPSALRTKTVNPPDSGIIVPSSARVFDPSAAYRAPITHTPRKRGTLGRR